MMSVMLVVIAVVGASSAHAERLRASDGAIKDVPSGSVEFALRDGYQRLPKVMMSDRDGRLYDIDNDQVEQYERIGFWRLTASEIEHAVAKESAQRREEAEMKSREAQMLEYARLDAAEEFERERYRWKWIKGGLLGLGVVIFLLRPWRLLRFVRQ